MNGQNFVIAFGDSVEKPVDENQVFGGVFIEVLIDRVVQLPPKYRRLDVIVYRRDCAADILRLGGCCGLVDNLQRGNSEPGRQGLSDLPFVKEGQERLERLLGFRDVVGLE